MSDKITAARAYLRQRLRQAKTWAEEGFPGSAFKKFCAKLQDRELQEDRLCTIRPHEYLDFGDIKQAKGIRFIATWQDQPTEAAYIDVLPAPDIAGKNPWVKVKAVDLDDGSKVLSKHDIIAETVLFDDCDERAAIDDFFKTYLRRAFANERRDKILNHKFPIERSGPPIE